MWTEQRSYLLFNFRVEGVFWFNCSSKIQLKETLSSNIQITYSVKKVISLFYDIYTKVLQKVLGLI